MLENDRGSCRCGAAKFEGGFDLTRDSDRCNRSICRGTRLWPAVAKPGVVAIGERMRSHRNLP